MLSIMVLLLHTHVRGQEFVNNMSMNQIQNRKFQTSSKLFLRSRMNLYKSRLMKALIGVGVLGLLMASSSIAFFVFQGKKIVQTQVETTSVALIQEEVLPNTRQFPVGVDPSHKEISENPIVDSYFEEHVAINRDATETHTSWLSKAMGKLVLMNWYQNLASISSRILVIESGERKEQVAAHFAKILG